MGDGPPDLFDQLPEDVTQMIFSAICDCKTLVRCMAVSQAFYHHAVSVSSLSIVCPDNYCTYEEKLNKICSMVKEFRELQTLVVRVGQPRDEPASWTRCMRYAEIGASVEKFVFVAAKSGDFSELDNVLASSEYSYDFENSISQGNVVQDVTESKCKDQADRASLSGKAKSNGTGNNNTWGHTQNRLDTEFQNSTSYPGLMWSFFLQSLLRLRGFPRIGRLCDFSLRQVIAPSNDVMRRMLPVIHFVILQGLNEFRDVIPSFIANFPKLKRLLLVDISESVTIHLRQHNMEEIRSLHPQDITDWEANNFVEEQTVAESCTGQEMHAAEEPPCNSALNVLDNVYAPISSSSGNGFIKFSKSSLNSECLHRPLVKSTEKSCSDKEMENSGRRHCRCSCSIIDDNLFANEAGGCISTFEHTEECNSQRDNIQEEITANGCKNSLQCEERESRLELYKCRSSRFQDIYHDGNMDCANKHTFKRESKNERLSYRDSSRSHKIGIFRTLDDFAGNLESMRKPDESLGEGKETHTRKRQQFQTEDEFQLSPQMSISSSDQSLINHPVNSGISQKHHQTFPECIWDQKPMESSFQLKDSRKTGSDKSFSGKDIVGNGRSSHGRHLNPQDSLLKERCLEGNIKESSSISSKRAVSPLQANQDTSTADRLMEREVWRGMRRERVRRLRYARRNSRTLEDVRRDSDAQRIVRNAFQRKKNDLEKEALSFEYSFWRAEQVVAENYHLSDLSICVATYSPKPLDLADIEILSYAALAGPFLAATVSHVNKQHSSHKL